LRKKTRAAGRDQRTNCGRFRAAPTFRKAPVLFTAALACAWSSHATAEPELNHTRLFETDGRVFYRIPALVITNEGTLLAVCNGRVGTPRDHCPYVQLAVRRSTDNGKTWGPMQMIQDRQGWVAVGGAGIVDPNTGAFFVLYEKGERHYRDKGVSIVKFNLQWLTDGKDLKDF